VSRDLSRLVVSAFESLGWSYVTPDPIEPLWAAEEERQWNPDVEVAQVQREGHLGAMVGIWHQERIVVGLPRFAWISHSLHRLGAEFVDELGINEVTVDRLVPILRRAHRTRRRRLRRCRFCREMKPLEYSGVDRLLWLRGAGVACGFLAATNGWKLL
jgi:hypothetical protein